MGMGMKVRKEAMPAARSIMARRSPETSSMATKYKMPTLIPAGMNRSATKMQREKTKARRRVKSGERVMAKRCYLQK
jgi:hypothetical protein